jgi:hypothetical protein
MNEGKIETEQPRNLLTHPELTISAMEELEGEEWRKLQGERVKSGQLTYTLEGAMKWLRGEGENDTGTESYTVYGFGGHNRWYVDEDGGVRLSRKHASPKEAAWADTNGF